jgi:hypothetical protein
MRSTAFINVEDASQETTLRCKTRARNFDLVQMHRDRWVP